MRAEYGGNPIRDYWLGVNSLRELRVMVDNLPPGSAWHRAAAGHGWQLADYMRADLIDAVLATGQFERRPEPYERPVNPKVRRRADKAQARSDRAMQSIVNQLLGG